MASTGHERKTIRSEELRFATDSAVAAADFALSHYSRSGVRLPPGNRLQMARKLLARIADGSLRVDVNDPELLERVKDAHVTVVEHHVIARSVTPRPGRPGDLIRSKITEALKGDELESKDKDHAARNAQFELYVGAVLTMGGAVVDLGEPDLRVLLGGDWFGVAAKRVQNEDRLLERAVEGAKQVAVAGSPGFVAVNVDRLPKTTPSVLGGDGHSTLADDLPILRAADAAIYGRPGVAGRFAFFRDVGWDLSRDRPRFVLGFREHFQVWFEPRERIVPDMDRIFNLVANRFARL